MLSDWACDLNSTNRIGVRRPVDFLRSFYSLRIRSRNLNLFNRINVFTIL